MKRYTRLTLIGLAALVSLISFLPAPLALAQSPGEGQNEETNGPEILIPARELKGGNDPNAAMPEVIIPSQGTQETQAQLVPTPLAPGTEADGNVPSTDTSAPNLEPGNQPAANREPKAETQPTLWDDLFSDLAPQVKAMLGAATDKMVERLNEWMHDQADQVSDSFNQWLHKEIDRLTASLKQWMEKELSESDDSGAVELTPLEG